MKTKRFYLIGVILLFIMRAIYGIEIQQDERIADIFRRENISGTFVLYDVERGAMTGHNEKRAVKQYQPASTFKIPNSLIGLSLGIINDVDENFYKYDGSKMWMKSWEKDVTLREAMALSHGPAFQQLARKIGAARMQENIKKLDYGNKKIGKNITTFWLRGPLKISAVEQTKFLAKLAKGELPYPKENQESVAEIIKLKEGSGWNLYGKTGWATRDLDKKLNPTLGWFAGWIEQDGKIYTFALNMDIKDSDQLPLRQETVVKILKVIGLLD